MPTMDILPYYYFEVTSTNISSRISFLEKNVQGLVKNSKRKKMYLH